MTSYWDYLKLDTILNAQQPITAAHDEPLFIIIHQVFETWFKLAIAELRTTIACLHNGEIAQATHYLHRVNVIIAASAHGFGVMDTMTPEAFREFREALIPASGTQSFQFRELELLAGMPQVRTVDDRKKYYWEDTPDAAMTLKLFFEKYGERLHAVEREVEANGTLRSTFTRLALKETHATGLKEAAGRATGALAELVREVKAFDMGMLLWRDMHVQTTRHAIADSPGTVLNEQGQLPTTSCVDYLKSTITVQERLLFPEFHES